MGSIYDVFADLYDQWQSDYTQDIPLWLEYAKKFGPPVLELACGTGRILIPVAREGIEITGLDSSGKMLKKAKENISKEPEEVQDRIKLVTADMRDFQLDQKFNLALIIFNSFQHLLTIEDQDRCLRSVYRHLESKGRLIITVFNPDLTRPEGVTRRDGDATVKDYPDKGDKTDIFYYQFFDQRKQETDVHYLLDVRKPNGQLLRRKISFTLHYFFPTEFERMLISNGFRVEELFGDYDKSGFTRRLPLMIFVAKKG
jgi:ubiquinone/menaquinone biosynthesis C-methylase UbiE